MLSCLPLGLNWFTGMSQTRNCQGSSLINIMFFRSPSCWEHCHKTKSSVKWFSSATHFLKFDVPSTELLNLINNCLIFKHNLINNSGTALSWNNLEAVVCHRSLEGVAKRWASSLPACCPLALSSLRPDLQSFQHAQKKRGSKFWSLIEATTVPNNITISTWSLLTNHKVGERSNLEPSPPFPFSLLATY